MEQININHLAVIVCAIANLAFGALWYSPAMFYKAWKKENNFTDEQLKTINPAKVYGLSFIMSVIMSYNMAFFLGDAKTNMAWGLTAGFLTGFGFAALIFTIVSLFEMRSWKYILINGGDIFPFFFFICFLFGILR